MQGEESRIERVEAQEGPADAVAAEPAGEASPGSNSSPESTQAVLT